jgi:four helix bundle protein
MRGERSEERGVTRQHHNLAAWREAIDPAKAVYEISGTLPQSERYGLISQMRRAAVSVPANIAEGIGRIRSRDRIQFLAVARGSLTELDTYAVLVKELGYAADTARLAQSIDKVFALLNGLINAERRKSATK